MKKYYIVILVILILVSSLIFVYTDGFNSGNMAAQALEKYYKAYIAMDINAIAESSIDEKYEEKDEYMSTLMDFFQHDGAQIISYEVISREKEGDGYVFEVRHMYKDNTLVEGKRYVEKINSDWIVYLSKEPSLRAFKLIEVPKDQQEYFETHLKPAQEEGIFNIN